LGLCVEKALLLLVLGIEGLELHVLLFGAVQKIDDDADGEKYQSEN
jgi:hypothetical protein